MIGTEKQLFDLLAFPAKGVRAVMISSADGAWTDGNGSSRGLSSADDLKWLVANRAVSDAVLVSAKTALSENYRQLNHNPIYLELRAAAGLPIRSKLVCLTSDVKRFEAVSEFADFILTTNPDLANRDRAIYFEHENLPMALQKLAEVGMHRLVIEGGPTLLDAFIAQGLVNQVALTKSANSSKDKNRFEHIEKFLEETPSLWQKEIAGFEYSLVGELPTWKAILPKHNFQILRKAHTEPAFSVPYEKEPADGYYSCFACGNKLFDAQNQFDARCGWPAFWKPDNDLGVRLIEDRSFGMRRVEVVCAACDSHLGHVFYGEGFGYPTDARYCINAASIKRH
jgi:peptide-methionine (R)-S-oxide reductase